MSTKFELTAEQRESFGKGNARRMRRLANSTPAIIYGGAAEPLPIQFPSHIIAHKLKSDSFYSSIVTIKLDKKSEKVILKAVQRHPASGNILHLDFLRIDEKKKLSIHVPIHFINEKDTPGIKQGGVPFFLITEVEVTCLPADIPEFIEVDLAKMEKGDVIHASDLKLPKGVELGSSVKEDAPVMTLSDPSPEKIEQAEGEEETEEKEEE